jgi:lantibiotic modifying enzyme
MSQSSERHMPLAEIAWDPAAAEAAIQRIVTDIRARFTPAGLWPLHPGDASPQDTEPQTSLYFGAAGVIWALDHLARDGAIPPGETFADHLGAVLQRNHAELDALGRVPAPSWLFGSSGILFTQHKIAPSAALEDALADLIAANTHDPACELMWGAPGTMLVALALYRSTGAPHWAALYRAGVDALEASLTLDPEIGADMWTQLLYGKPARYLGAAHGFAGNAFALIAGRDLIASATWAKLAARITATIEATAVRKPHGINWPSHLGPLRAGTEDLTQHCHGAPGMINALATLETLDDALLTAAGQLVWAAGPLAKGSNLCHGTAGNALAFLKLFTRIGDQLWLDRARAFAMHAIAQSDAEAARLGQRRYSLWTGDAGLACFLWECLTERSRFPTMDVL